MRTCWCARIPDIGYIIERGWRVVIRPYFTDTSPSATDMTDAEVIEYFGLSHYYELKYAELFHDKTYHL